MKVTILGGGGVRTPLLVHALAGLANKLALREVSLFDVDAGRTGIIAALCREIIRREQADLQVTVHTRVAEASEGSAFVINSVRVGGIGARARDERIAIEHGLAGQETTGPGGVAMALRTIPVALAHAREVERVAPSAWFINFSNPAGLVTEALRRHSGVRAVGICDTPIELFHKIADAVGAPVSDLRFEYAGLNHLGWVRRVWRSGEEITASVLGDRDTLLRIYPETMFDPALIQTLGLIPTEYLYFYYRQRVALANQQQAGASRGAELEKLNQGLLAELAPGGAAALDAYKRYLLRRNESYMKLETQAGSAFAAAAAEYDPFATATGYHRVAAEVIEALHSAEGRTIVVNTTNGDAVEGVDAQAVVEVPCHVSREGVTATHTGPLPASVRGLVEAVKAYEQLTIRAAVERSGRLAELAMMTYPIIGQWDLACSLRRAMVANDPEYLGYLA